MDKRPEVERCNDFSGWSTQPPRLNKKREIETQVAKRAVVQFPA